MHTNRLIHEKSPYLLQHAHNPVDWYAWGEEAFEKARREDKPIFLSIGYSTCHWCHVMERESFENDAIAEILNRSFVSIKLDREERPDVDRVYMTFVQATTGSGGWPMSVWLTPELKPFYGGTYFPPDNRYGRPGFGALLQNIAAAWVGDRPGIEQSCVRIVEEIKKATAVTPSAGLPDSEAVRQKAFLTFRRVFDSRYGGFGGAPKFPRPSVFQYLLRESAWSGDSEAQDMALKTLTEMAKGGMYDHLGGGFHRYSVDAKWFVSHFEKMLYDQAQLVVAYLEAYQLTGDERFANVARDVLGYVARDMRHPGGAFYSAEDADSVIDPANPHEKGEGAFYIWTKEELDQLLGEDAEWFAQRFGVRDDGNVFDNDPHGEFTGRNILFLADENAGSAERFAAVRERLLAARSQRPRPHLDDKILTSWNAMMISAFAKAAQVLGDPRYLDIARAAASFLRANLFSPEGILLRRWRDGEAAIPAFLDDYASLGHALLDLYETDFDEADLVLARALAGDMSRLFEDAENGGFFSTVDGDPRMLLRMKEDYDGAEPSGNSVAILLLIRLGETAKAERALSAFASRLTSSPVTIPLMTVALEAVRRKAEQVIFAGERDAAQPLIDEVHRTFSPFRVLLLNPPLAGFAPVDGKAAAYVCRDFTCQMPVTDVASLRGMIGRPLVS